LKQITSQEVLVHLLKCNKYELHHITSFLKQYYVKKIILKSEGSTRELSIPKRKLKVIQRNILKHILVNHPVSSVTHGWVKSKSRFSCLQGHIYHTNLITLDINNYFDSIHYSSIYKIFNINLQFSRQIATILTKLTTYEHRLPQGAPTSPCLANIYLYSFDNYLSNYCKKMKVTYTRFGDDMIFSSNSDIIYIINKINFLLKQRGLKIATQKTTISTNLTNRVPILGLIVSDSVYVPKKERKLVEAILINSQKTGLERQNIHQIKNFTEHIKGRVNNIIQISSNRKKKYLALLNNITK